MQLSRVLSRIIVIGLVSTAAVSAAKVSLEMKCGLNLAKWRGEPSLYNENVVSGTPEDKAFKPGVIGGFGLRIAFIDYLALQPELFYSMKGFKRIYDVGGEELALFLRVNYIELPILLKVTIPAGPVMPNFYAGPALATRVKLEGHTIMDGKKEEFFEYQRVTYNNRVRIFDLSIAMGGGIDIKVGSGSMFFDMRYTMGLRNLWIGSRTNPNIAKEKNSTLSFILGYAFHLSK